MSSAEAAAVGRSCAPSLGITRVARVTGLDRIAIPVWTAIRPNALSLSVSQGKGIDDDAAVASAIFEAAELAAAERPHPAAFSASRNQLLAVGGKTLDATRFLRKGKHAPGDSEPESWVEGLDLLSGEPILIPEDVIRVADVPGCRYWQTSDGLGIGSNILEAAIHGLCEIVERDAMALWSLLDDVEVASREVGIATLHSDDADAVLSKIATAGLTVRLFDATSDTGIPTYLAVLIDNDRRATGIRYLDVASGSGAHPVAARAALRALTEAVQTRLTTITGSRDDVDPTEYARLLPSDLSIYAGVGAAERVATPGFSGLRNLSAYLDWLVERLRAARIRTVALVELEAPELPFVVTRVIAPDLEQDPRTGNRRPGRRLLAAMMGGQ